MIYKLIGIEDIIGAKIMNIPLILDLSNPKWLIVQEILKSIGSTRARKIASRLKIPDVQVFIDCMKILILAETFELDYSYVVSEIEKNNKISPEHPQGLGDI